MAEPLKNSYGPEVPGSIAENIKKVFPEFKARPFLKDTLAGYDDLELMPRGWRIARTLRSYLPSTYPEAVGVLLSSLKFPPKMNSKQPGMSPFFYLPHTLFVAEYGLDHFEESMRALYLLTQRFTAEFAIRPFLEHHPKATLARLEEWASDPNPHVRRLVSEGTRPRLPWASRLRPFQADPTPVLRLLEMLKDDPELYVRRSVANNLNDIGKDHPAVLVETARRWMVDATEERRWIVRHALRSSVKRGDSSALAVLGFNGETDVAIRNGKIAPKSVPIGGSVSISFDVVNTGSSRQRVLVDYCVHFAKANSKSGAKVFKLKTFDLAPGELVRCSKKVSLVQMTTRKHYPGRHRVEVLVNGRTFLLGGFKVSAA